MVHLVGQFKEVHDMFAAISRQARQLAAARAAENATLAKAEYTKMSNFVAFSNASMGEILKEFVAASDKKSALVALDKKLELQKQVAEAKVKLDKILDSVGGDRRKLGYLG